MGQMRLRTRVALAVVGPRDPTVATVAWLAANGSTRALSRVVADDLLPWSVRQDAARALGELPPPAGTAPLAEIARKSLEFELIEEATLALAKRGQVQAVPGCLRLIDGLITDYVGRDRIRRAEPRDDRRAPRCRRRSTSSEPLRSRRSSTRQSSEGAAARWRSGHEYLRRPDNARIVALLRIGPTAIAAVTAALSSSSPQTAASAARVAARVGGTERCQPSWTRSGTRPQT